MKKTTKKITPAKFGMQCVEAIAAAMVANCGKGLVLTREEKAKIIGDLFAKHAGNATKAPAVTAGQPESPAETDPVKISYEIMLAEFTSVKRASIMERIELAWQQNGIDCGIDMDSPFHMAPPVCDDDDDRDDSADWWKKGPKA